MGQPDAGDKMSSETVFDGLEKGINRRDFLKAGIAGAAAGSAFFSPGAVSSEENVSAPR